MGEDLGVARQHEVVAIVDHPVEPGVVKAPGPATGAVHRLVQHHFGSGAFGQAQRGGEAREPRADDMDAPHRDAPGEARQRRPSTNLRQRARGGGARCASASIRPLPT